MVKKFLKSPGAISVAAALIVMGIVVLVLTMILSLPGLGKIEYRNVGQNTSEFANSTSTLATSSAEIIPVSRVTHISPPESIKAVYFTSWAAGTPSFRKHLDDLLDGTILNAVVIDVKDYSGKIAFPVSDLKLAEMGSVENRIPDIEDFIIGLHKKGIYVIGRVAVFQDPFIVKVKPEWAVTNKDTGKLWKDSGGMLWADPTRKEVWHYNVSIAKEAYKVGFDEINFDYIRFPSDGAVSSAVYNDLKPGYYIYKPIALATSTTTSLASSTRIATSTLAATSTKIFVTGKSEVMKNFFAYLHKELREGGNDGTSPIIPISADLFGQTTSDPGDMGIGQLLENAMPYFDYIDPMVYPSHYINGFMGYEKPALHPYGIVKGQMDSAVERSLAASSSPLLMRPWLQAFDLGAKYTPKMVQDQMRATYDAGLTSWILWNAGSKYDKTALLKDPKTETVAKEISTGTSTRP
jgi:hypothetical protein